MCTNRYEITSVLTVIIIIQSVLFSFWQIVFFRYYFRRPRRHIHYSLFIIHYSLKKVALSDDFSRTLKTEQRECEDRRIGQALGLLVQPGTHVAMLTPVAYQPGSLPGTLLAYAMGNLILRLASCLDAFSVYPIRT